MSFQRVLIANRGEIALRVVRSLRDLGLESVAVYSDADAQSRHRFEADFAVRLPGSASADTYLNIPAILDALKRSGADAVHPGYGFLSERGAFVDAVTAAGATFIGPSSRAMDAMGNKVHAKHLMIEHGVPVVPGSKGALKDAAELQRLATEIGYPLILKAANGGGGRGMRVVRKDIELAPAFEACTREAIAYFGSGDVFCERYIEDPRHIEFQVLFDNYGNGVHLHERDCSIQRRHQKLFEEAPSPYLSDAQRQKIGAAAVAAAKAAGYSGAGTIEFICESPERAYFMEMNTRIQVEHPVTEMITGIDLIGWQIRVARGEKLAFQQKDVPLRGWSMEARINAEDPAKDFAPGPGLVTALTFPAGPFVRVDTHLYAGYAIPSHYDSMVAKVITWGETRDEAMRRMSRALMETKVEGVPTTTRFHEALLAHPEFKAGTFSTRFIEQKAAYFKEKLAGDPAALAEGVGALVAAALTADETQRGADHASAQPPRDSAWRRAGREA